MGLKDTLKKDFVKFYKARDTPAYMALRRVNTAVSNLETSKAFVKSGKAVQDSDVLGVLSTEVKKLKESASQVQENMGNLADAAHAEDALKETQREIDVLSAYLPQEMSKDEIQAVVNEVIAETENPNMGSVMKGVMSKVKTREDGKTADGKTVKEVVLASL